MQSCCADLTCCGISSFSISFSGMERSNPRFHKAHLLESIGVCPTSSLQQFQLRDLSSFHFWFETPGAAFGENVILMSGGQDTTVQAKGDFKLLKWWDVTGDFRK